MIVARGCSETCAVVPLWSAVGGRGTPFSEARMADLRFCAYQYQHLPLDALRGRWRDAERSGFDVLWNCDTVVEPDRPRHTLFDGPATLTMMAADTRRIRVGTWVTLRQARRPAARTGRPVNGSPDSVSSSSWSTCFSGRR